MYRIINHVHASCVQHFCKWGVYVMGLIINHNIMASNTARNLNIHYGSLSAATRRLSSGLRVNTAADDAAGLAIRELQRADIAALQQGVRNANDAISLIQTADGALQVIDEKLIRMKELAEQASTGTYDSTQRLMIDSEFQAMAAEINRIATATDFNGIKLLDGSLSGMHDGGGLQSLGALKIHFGAGNDAAEDYYYVDVAGATIGRLGLGRDHVPPIMSERLTNGAGLAQFPSGVVSFAMVPKGTVNLRLHLYDHGANDSIQVFTTSGVHVAGTVLGGGDWASAGVRNAADADRLVMVEDNGFLPGASYNDAALNGGAGTLPYTDVPPYNQFTYNGMNIGYSGDGNATRNLDEYLTIDNVTEDLIVISAGSGIFSMQGAWDFMPEAEPRNEAISIATQEQAQKALEKLSGAIVRKDNIRAHLGSIQNRLENTVSNLNIQAENLQVAESRISDTDVGTEMASFVRNQILTQASVAMLAHANTLPKAAMQLISG